MDHKLYIHYAVRESCRFWEIGSAVDATNTWSNQQYYSPVCLVWWLFSFYLWRPFT